MVYPLAVLAALLVGVGTAIEQRMAALAPPEYSLSPRLLGWLARQPRWLAGVGTTQCGNLVFAIALGVGSVAVVEAVYILRLLFALTVSAAWGRHRVPLRDVTGALAVGVGLTGFLVAARPAEGTTLEVPGLLWVICGGSVVGFALVLAVIGSRARPVRKAVLLGLAAGALFGLQASLVHTVVELLTESGFGAVVTTWEPYVVVVLALVAMLVEQSAYGSAPLPASYPAVVTTELLAGIALAIWLLGGTVSLHPVGITFASLGIVAMVGGVYLLTTSPLVTGQLDRLARQQDVGLAQRIEAGLQRLHELQVDIQRHRHLERERFEGAEGADADEWAAQDHELREHERVVAERAAELRHWASRFGAVRTGA